MSQQNSSKCRIKEHLKKEKLIFDGAFGTYYAKIFDTRELPELANIMHPERVRKIHDEYISAGAQIIRTNTFASNTIVMKTTLEEVLENVRKGYGIAVEAARGKDVYVAADIGQIPYDNEVGREKISEEYVEICRTFLEEGANIFVFETFSEIDDILEAIKFIGDKAFIIVQFSVNQFGYSNSGLSAKKLATRAEAIEYVDAVGFNCGVGPGHMHKIIKSARMTGKKIVTALANAGYPQNVSNRMIFSNKNIDYYVAKMGDIASDGVDIIGGCCGTTPEYIKKMRKKIPLISPKKELAIENEKEISVIKEEHSFFAGKGAKKLIAVELAPPFGSDDEKIMDAAHLLKRSGVDVLTFPDSPSGRTRADSVLMAEKVTRETGMCVMPHICCRDKNAIAMRSQLLGAHINDIHNFLVITGDPIPTMVRSSVKSVFNFDSVGLMRIMGDMNDEQFVESPVTYGGAINQTRLNLDMEIKRVKKKMEAGATFFLTQPICTNEGALRVRRIKEETGARILCGIMPFVSLKNATFIKNEMTGIDVDDEVLSRYREDMTKAEGEEVGIELAKEIMEMTKDFADGYYFSFPFNRVSMLEKILA